MCNNNCTDCNCNHFHPIFSSDIQDIYEISKLGIRLVVNKFTVDEEFKLPRISNIKRSFIEGSHYLTRLDMPYYHTQGNKKYAAGTCFFKGCLVIPTEDTTKWGFNLISREDTILMSDIIDIETQIKKVIASYIYPESEVA